MDRSQALLELGLRGLELGEGIREAFQLLVQLLLD